MRDVHCRVHMDVGLSRPRVDGYAPGFIFFTTGRALVWRRLSMICQQMLTVGMGRYITRQIPGENVPCIMTGAA